MADYRHERSSKRKLDLPKKKPVDLGLETPPTPRSSHRRRERELQMLLNDFRLGLTSLRNLASRTQVTKSDFKAQAPKTQTPSDFKAQAPKTQTPPASITRIIEKERHIIERTLMALPANERELIMRSYTTHLNSVVNMQTPQAYAAILRGAQTIQPAKVMRPSQPYVRELMATAQAIRSGRAAFLPREVKEKARTLLTILFGKQQAATMLQSKDSVTQKLIRQYRLVPQAVRAAVSGIPTKQMTRVERELQTTLHRVMRQPGQPISRAEMATLAPALPALHTGGVAAASGEYRMETGENVHVITRDDPLMTAPNPPGPNEVSERTSGGALHQTNGVRSPTSKAPPPADSVTPSPNESKYKAGTRLDKSVGDMIHSEAGQSSRGGGIKVEDIDGLSRWIAQTERKLSEL